MEKRFNIFALVILFSFFTLPVYSQAPNFPPAEQIQDYQVKIDILESGKINVVETITYDFGTLERHGIFRDIPYIKTNQEGKKFKMEFAGWKIEDKKGGFYDFEISTVGDSIHLKIGDPDVLITGVHEYTISYTVSGALTYFSDHDELYWDAIGAPPAGGWTVPIMTSSVTITAPPGGESYRFECFTGFAGSTEKDCKISESMNKAAMSVTRPLQAAEGLTVVAGFPIGLVAHLEPTPMVDFFDTLLGKMTLIAIILAGFLWYILYPIWIAAKWYLYGRDPIIGAELTAHFDEPTTASGQALRPGEAGVLIDEMVHPRDVAATMVDRARRGYFSIEEKKAGEIYLHKSSQPKLVGKSINEDKLANFEKKLFDDLFAEGDSLKLKDSELYTTVKEVEKKLYDNVVKYGLFNKNPQKVRDYYGVMGVLGLMSFNFQLALSAFLFGRAMPAKTAEGARAAGKARGLRNFFKSQEKLIDFQSKLAGANLDKQVLFEKLLPYAVAFGVEKDWIKRFESLNLEQPDWYSSYRGAVFADSFGKSMNSTMDSFRASATPTSSSSGFSSGFSGGSSGGGGGGGGGGSW